jgi:hypothetical protein
MGIAEILYYVALLFSVVLAVISTILAVKEKKKKKTDNCENRTESVDGISQTEKTSVNTSEGFWSEMWQKIPIYMVKAEEFYNQIVGRVSGIKTGVHKLSQVLDKVKMDCLSSNVEYDEDKATAIVESLMTVANQINSNK